MPYKKNPMLAERLCSLSRMVPQYRNMVVETAANQWLERSLDDSAIRRVAMTDIFLAMSGALRTAIKIISGLSVDTRASKLHEYHGYFCSEFIIIDAVKDGLDRQEVHEILRSYMVGTKNSSDFLKGVSKDKVLGKYLEGRNYRTDELIGRAYEQTREYVGSIEHWF